MFLSQKYTFIKLQKTENASQPLSKINKIMSLSLDFF